MHSIPQLDRKGLREFGLVTGGIVAVLFGLFLPWLLEYAWPTWPWVLAGALTAWALIHPMSLNPVYRGWMRIGHVLGWISTRIVLSVVFYLMITPMSFIMRLFRYDPMRRRQDADAASYRTICNPRPKEHMERPF